MWAKYVVERIKFVKRFSNIATISTFIMYRLVIWDAPIWYVFFEGFDILARQNGKPCRVIHIRWWTRPNNFVIKELSEHIRDVVIRNTNTKTSEWFAVSMKKKLSKVIERKGRAILWHEELLARKKKSSEYHSPVSWVMTFRADCDFSAVFDRKVASSAHYYRLLGFPFKYSMYLSLIG